MINPVFSFTPKSHNEYNRPMEKIVTTQHPPSMMRVPTALIFHKLDFRLIPNQC